MQWDPLHKAWYANSYDEVEQILLNKDFSPNMPQGQRDHVIEQNRIHHLNFRRSIIESFHKKNTWIQTTIDRVANEVLVDKKSNNEFEIAESLIIPFCKKLGLALLGLPESEEKQFNNANKIFYMANGSSKELAEGSKATSELSMLIMNVLQSRQKNSVKNDDLLTAFLDKTPIPAQLISPLIQLFVGVGTSLPLMLGNIFHALLSDPDQAKLYLNKPSKVVNELIRYTGPSQYVKRFCIRDTQFHEHNIKSGDEIRLFLSNANRDETRFCPAHQLKFSRPTISNLSFGKGDHSCLGASLIRDVCIRFPVKVFEHFQNLKLQDDRVDRGGSRTIEGVIVLWVRCE